MPRAALSLALAALLGRVALGSGEDASDTGDVTMYFGCGCFWHVQHEFVEAERSILGRSDSELTALVGYAGGTGLNSAGRVCYPYYSSHGDSALYHTEVVQVTVPRSSVSAFAQAYWRLFVGINRVDVQDVGKWYRAAIGVQGGLDSALMAEIEAAQTGIVQQTFQLQRGVGADADTLGQALVWVYDTAEFPFYQGEIYHQFHDDMVEKYPQAYNDLKDVFAADCRILPTGCTGDDGSPPASCAGTLAGTPAPPSAGTPAPSTGPTEEAQPNGAAFDGGSGGSGGALHDEGAGDTSTTEPLTSRATAPVARFLVGFNGAFLASLMAAVEL